MDFLLPGQRELVEAPIGDSIFLEGPAGCGKTTVGAERLRHLLACGIPGDSILVIVPQRTLADPYFQVLNDPDGAAGGIPNIVTVGGLAQRMVELFWPVAARRAGFAHGDRPPVFLTLETAQYYMARLVRPLLGQGYFESVAISRNRIYSQVLDNLNKAAVVGFDANEIGPRLKEAWLGEPAQLRIYDDAQQCAALFRRYCLEHNLLDFSLQMEVFRNHLWPDPIVHGYLASTYQHLLADNLEEDTPAAHDLLAEWLPHFESSLLIYDWDSGYRSFLGADPETGYALREGCKYRVALEQSFVTTHPLEALASSLANAIQSIRPPAQVAEPAAGGPRQALKFETHRYYPQMFDWVAQNIAQLVSQEYISPGEIVVLAPFLTDSLRFSLAERLQREGLAVRSHRPSRALREEPAAQCLLTLAALAHPAWGLRPSKFDVVYAFMEAIEDLDLVRAQLLAEAVFRIHDGQGMLLPFEKVRPDLQGRVTYLLGQRYESLRRWLADYASEPVDELDYFFSRLFGEVLSQPGYRFHRNYTAGEVAANLVDSARSFRWAITGPDGVSLEDDQPLGKEYIEMVQDGVVAAQYVRSWAAQPEDAVLLAPAYTFLMNNRPVDYQFWIDIGSRAWFERLEQPLTHPHVLSRRWTPHTTWTDIEEHAANQATLTRLAVGLVRRCRRGVFLGLSDLNEQGYESQGPFLKAIQRVLRQHGVEDNELQA